MSPPLFPPRKSAKSKLWCFNRLSNGLLTLGGLLSLKFLLHMTTSFIKENHFNKGRTIIFPRGGGGIVFSRFQEIFFYHRLSACKIFSSTHCADNFLIPQIRITGVASADNFFQMHLWCRQFISAIFLMQTIFFPIAIPPGEKIMVSS